MRIQDLTTAIKSNLEITFLSNNSIQLQIRDLEGNLVRDLFPGGVVANEGDVISVNGIAHQVHVDEHEHTMRELTIDDLPPANQRMQPTITLKRKMDINETS